VLGLLLVLSSGSCKRDDGASEADGVVEVSFWYAYGGTNRQVTEELIASFNASHPKIRVKGTYQGDYFEALAKVRVASRTSRGPAVTHVVSESLPALWEDGLVEPLDGYARGEGGATAVDLADFIPALSQDGTFDYLGKEVPLFALPFNRSTPIVFYNKKMLADAGVSPPQTWEELEAAARTLTVREGDQTKVWGFELPISWWFWYALLHQADGRLLSEDGKTAMFGHAAGQEALGLLVRMVKQDKTMKNPPGRDYNAWEVANTDFLSGRVAMIWTSTAFLNYLTENAKFELGTAFLPGFKRKAVPTGGTFFVVMKGRPEAEKRAGWEFVRWMTEPEQTKLWSQKTGYMPVRRSVVESAEMKAFYVEHSNWRTTIDQLDHAVRFPFSPKLLEIQRDLLQPNLEKPVVTDATVESVLGKAEADANALLGR